MGTVVVGYVAKAEGEAALGRAIDEARLRGSAVVVVSSHRGGQEHDGRVAEIEAELDAVRARLEEAGVPFTLRQTVLQLKEEGKTVFLITHRPAILGIVDHLLMLQDGELKAHGPREEVLAALRLAAQAQAATAAAALAGQPA